MLPPSSPTLSTDHNDNNNDIPDQDGPMRGLLDDESIAWWTTWRKRNENAAARHNNSSSRRRPGGINNNNKQRKKRKIIVDPDEDGDTHMFGDNEQEDDTEVEEEKKTEKEKEKKVKELLSSDFVESADEDFKPMAVSEIKVDEEAMHEDIRILIKVSVPLPRGFFFPVIDSSCIAGYHRWFCQARRPV